MNSKRIEGHLGKVAEDWIKSLPVHIQSEVRCNTIITGGAVVSMLQGEEPKDYDLYFKSFSTALTLACHYGNMMGATVHDKDMQGNERVVVAISGGYLEGEKSENLFSPLFLTSNAITLSNKIQLIIRFTGEAEEIHGNFDFIHCQNHYDVVKEKLHLNPKSLESILNKELFYCGSRYPLASILRARKFLERGWTCNAGQYLKMALQLQRFNLNDPEVLRDQLMGVDLAYFMNMMSCLKADDIKDGMIEQTYLFELINKFF